MDTNKFEIGQRVCHAEPLSSALGRTNKVPVPVTELIGTIRAFGVGDVANACAIELADGAIVVWNSDLLTDADNSPAEAGETDDNDDNEDNEDFVKDEV